MKYGVRLREEAEQDLAAAASWYEQQRVGLGHAFLDETLAAFELIADQPLVYPIIYRDLRRALLPRFPFGVYFKITATGVVVLAIIHGSRNPSNWQTRS
jgi:toxin ParE1/3/4